MDTNFYKIFSDPDNIIEISTLIAFEFWYVWLIVAVIILIIVAQKIIYLRKLEQSGLLEIDEMSGSKFEEYLKHAFRKSGYHVSHVGKTSDYGTDLILEKDGDKTVVQAKRYSTGVGVSAVQEVVAAKAYYKAALGMVVTNKHFTPNAQVLARLNGIDLVDRSKLTDLIMKNDK